MTSLQSSSCHPAVFTVTVNKMWSVTTTVHIHYPVEGPPPSEDTGNWPVGLKTLTNVGNRPQFQVFRGYTVYDICTLLHTLSSADSASKCGGYLE